MTDFSKIDKYEVVEQIGEGSFGTVYKGRDPFLKRDVAIKVCTLADVGLRRRFFREAEIAGKLQHKNIVTVFAFGFEGEVPYLVQEYLPGQDLQQLIEEGTAAPTVDKLDILLQVAARPRLRPRPRGWSTATSSRPTSGCSTAEWSRSWTSASPSWPAPRPS